MLKKQDRIIALVRKNQIRYLTRHNVGGIKLTKTVEQVLALDAKHAIPFGQILYTKAMDSVKMSLKNLPDGMNAPKHHQFV